MTLNNLYKQIVYHLSEVATDEAKTIAYLLLEHYTSYGKLFVCLNPDTDVDDVLVEKINEAVRELQHHRPIQYVLGETVFCGLRFMVNESVLIPRQETEELVSWILEESSPSSTLLDICTGSGCIAIALANVLKNKVYAIDLFEKTLETAQKNATLNGVDIHFMQKDVLSADFGTDINELFDVIVSNPPYVRESEKQYMHQRVLNFEPREALFVEDKDPLLFYRKILEFGKSHLKDNGKIFFEINETFGEEIVDLFSQYGYKDIVLRKDIHNKNRMVRGKVVISD